MGTAKGGEWRWRLSGAWEVEAKWNRYDVKGLNLRGKRHEKNASERGSRNAFSSSGGTHVHMSTRVTTR